MQPIRKSARGTTSKKCTSMASSASKKKALFIVEGTKSERNFVKKLSSLAAMPMEIFSVCANIHMLYGFLKNLGFNFNIIDALLSLNGVSESDKDMLRKESGFAYIYLVFDLDLQHYDISKPENIQRGLSEIVEMVHYFNDETDPTIGKMYINYPMFESYRDCHTFFDDEYKTATIAVNDICQYKNLVHCRGLRMGLSKFTSANFSSLALMNVYKANYINCGSWEKPTYTKYLASLNQVDIAEAEATIISQNGFISVLNCSLFILIDYYGNQDGFYDNLQTVTKVDSP